MNSAELKEMEELLQDFDKLEAKRKRLPLLEIAKVHRKEQTASDALAFFLNPIRCAQRKSTGSEPPSKVNFKRC